MSKQTQVYSDVALPRPAMEYIPDQYRERIGSLFDTWYALRARNQRLTAYYTMKNPLKDLGISIPKEMTKLNCAVGWCAKAVDAMVNRSVFDGFVFQGVEDEALNRLVIENRMRTLYPQVFKSSLIHGVSAVSVMRGIGHQPAAKVRGYSANQFSCLWDKDEGRIACGIICADVDDTGSATKYVAHFPESVLTLERVGDSWVCAEEENALGRPLMEVFVHDPDFDRPLGHSLFTRELRGVVDKAMRDILRMEIGAEFFTFPQRYALGVSDDLFTVLPEDAEQNDDGEWVDKQGNIVHPTSDEAKKWKAYVGALWALTRDEDGEVPQVGQFNPSDAGNFTCVYENDAQRASGISSVPLMQLGVQSNNYTSSDALGAANDPLILAVEVANRRNSEVLEDVARMMMAVANQTTLEDLAQSPQWFVQASFKDPSMPTIAARADAWTKLGANDEGLVGTRVYYEGVGLSRPTIDRLENEKEKRGIIDSLNAIEKAMAPALAKGEIALPQDASGHMPDDVSTEFEQ